jgi:hypothetical protein
MVFLNYQLSLWNISRIKTIKKKKKKNCYHIQYFVFTQLINFILQVKTLLYSVQ